MTSCTESVRGGFWGFEQSQRVEFLPRKKTVDFRSSPKRDPLFVAEAARGSADGGGGGGGQMKKSA